MNPEAFAPFEPGDAIGIPWPVVRWGRLPLSPKLIYGVLRTATAARGCELTHCQIGHIIGRTASTQGHVSALRESGLLEYDGRGGTIVRGIDGRRIWIPVELVADPQLHSPAKVIWGVLALCNERGFAPDRDQLHEMVGSPPWSVIHRSVSQLEEHGLAFHGTAIQQRPAPAIAAEGCAS